MPAPLGSEPLLEQDRTTGHSEVSNYTDNLQSKQLVAIPQKINTVDCTVYSTYACVYDLIAFRYIQLLSFETCTRHLQSQDTVHVDGSRLKTEDENKQSKQKFLCCGDH
ncbi:hypothetical protein TNCV_1152041 [Trichonephila clavipes]|nr:hypothetical protein TNCV_1152041 [Trichonephila clavipes]